MFVHTLLILTLHTLRIPSHSLKKSWFLWPVMMNDSAPTQNRKPTKVCSFENRETVTIVKIKKGTLREGDRERQRDRET